MKSDVRLNENIFSHYIDMLQLPGVFFLNIYPTSEKLLFSSVRFYATDKRKNLIGCQSPLSYLFFD